MSRKFFWIILISHLIVPISLFFPVLQDFEISNSSTLFNIFDFIRQNQYVYITVLLITFILIELCGLANAIYCLTKKAPSNRNISISFLFGFSSAILGAMFISVGSYPFFIICAVSFLLISYSSIKLMKLEK